MQRAAYDLLGIAPERRRPAAVAAPRAPGRPDVFPLRRDFDAIASWSSRRRATTRSCGSKATACTRSRSARCTPAPSSRGTSASRSSARRCCGSRSGSATRTRASRSASRRMTLVDGARLAGRVSRRSHRRLRLGLRAWRSKASRASTPPPRALWLRALLLERERIANHLGDLGYLGNDGGLAFGLAQFSRLKEDVLRAERGALRPSLPDGLRRARAASRATSRRTASRRDRARSATRSRARSRTLRDIYDEHAGLQDRFIAAGRVAPELARAARPDRASPAARAARRWDLRVRVPARALRPARRAHGDARRRRRRRARRRALRRDRSSRCGSSRLIVERPAARARSRRRCPTPPAGALGIGWVEGWRGEVLVALESGAGRHASAAAIRTTRRGRTGRCSSTR